MLTFLWKFKKLIQQLEAQRGDAQSLIDAGVPVWKHPFGNGEAQVWGSPQVTDDYKFTANVGLDLDDSKKFYMFANYAEKNVLGVLLLQKS